MLKINSLAPFRRLAARQDSEHNQAIVRLVIVSVVFVYVRTQYVGNLVGEDGIYFSLDGLTVVSWLTSLIIFLAIVLAPAVSPVRRFVAMAHDVAAISATIYFGSSAGAVIAVIYLWITIGNGFRYGPVYLYICAACCVLGFSVVWWHSDYWRANDTLSLNILVTLLIVPPYVARLLKSLHQAQAELRQWATTDSVTGLLSRREFQAKVKNKLDATPTGHVLLFCDLDKFKAVNDTAGHAAGDRLLADVGKVLRRSVRQNDLCGRMGGDEFCIFLEDCSSTTGREVAEKLRQHIAKLKLVWGDVDLSVGVSIGLARSDEASDEEALFRHADEACYEAKRLGRNTVCLSGTAVPDTRALSSATQQEPGTLHKLTSRDTRTANSER